MDNASYSKRWMWTDKYRPRTIDALDFNPKVTRMISDLARNKAGFPHLIFYGPPGAGKMTRIHVMLRELYGPDIDSMKLLTKQMGSKFINIVTSKYHMEINANEFGGNDHHVIQAVLEDIVTMPRVDVPFRTVVIKDMDCLSSNAQHSLRRTMEVYIKTCRLILCCNTICHIISPIRSRLQSIRVGAPTVEEIHNVLTTITEAEGGRQPPDATIANTCDRSLTRAIMMLQSARFGTPPWIQFIDDLGKRAATNQGPESLLEIRVRLYRLLTNCIPPTMIIKQLTKSLCLHHPSDLGRMEIHMRASELEHQMVKGSQPIFHIEALVAAAMHIFRNTK